MDAAFYLAGGVAIAATMMMLTRLEAVHALLYLIVSLLAVAVVFYAIGAHYIAALEVIVYAGAVMVLFVFVVMLLNLGEEATARERRALRPRAWIGPSILAAVLLAEIATLLTRGPEPALAWRSVTPREIGVALYGPYLIGVELSSLLLLGAVVGAYHLGWRSQPANREEDQHGNGTDDARAAAGRHPVRAGADGTAGAPEPGVPADVD